VTVGIRFDLQALLDDPSNLAMVPIFLAALLLIRGLPALASRRFVGPRRAAVAGVLQATSLPFIVAATAIGMELGAVDSTEASPLIAAGLLSVLIFPLGGLVIMRQSMEGSRSHHEPSGLHSSRYAPTMSPERGKALEEALAWLRRSADVGDPNAARLPDVEWTDLTPVHEPLASAG
jgi:Kef-type K+ transport system membrane component KefB